MNRLTMLLLAAVCASLIAAVGCVSTERVALHEDTGTRPPTTPQPEWKRVKPDSAARGHVTPAQTN